MLKIKLILIAFGMAAAVSGGLYLKGFDDGLAHYDQEAFNAYVSFAKPFQHAVKQAKYKQHHAATVWDAID